MEFSYRDMSWAIARVIRSGVLSTLDHVHRVERTSTATVIMSQATRAIASGVVTGACAAQTASTGAAGPYAQWGLLLLPPLLV